MPVDLATLRTVLDNLEEQHNHLRHLESDTPRLTREGITESVIQRFEICYDITWKTLRRFLIEELRIPDIPNSPKPIFRIAAENRLVGDAGQRWQDYSRTRIQTTHMYNQEIVDSAIALIPAFLRDAANLAECMERGTWND